MIPAYKYVLHAIVDGEFDAVDTVLIEQIMHIAADCAEAQGVDPDCDGLFDAAAAHLTLLKAKLLVVK